MPVENYTIVAVANVNSFTQLITASIDGRVSFVEWNIYPGLSSPSSFEGITQNEGMVKSLNSVVVSKVYLHLGRVVIALMLLSYLH